MKLNNHQINKNAFPKYNYKSIFKNNVELEKESAVALLRCRRYGHWVWRQLYSTEKIDNPATTHRRWIVIKSIYSRRTDIIPDSFCQWHQPVSKSSVVSLFQKELRLSTRHISSRISRRPRQETPVWRISLSIRHRRRNRRISMSGLQHSRQATRLQLQQERLGNTQRKRLWRIKGQTLLLDETSHRHRTSENLRSRERQGTALNGRCSRHHKKRLQRVWLHRLETETAKSLGVRSSRIKGKSHIHRTASRFITKPNATSNHRPGWTHKDNRRAVQPLSTSHTRTRESLSHSLLSWRSLPSSRTWWRCSRRPLSQDIFESKVSRKRKIGADRNQMGRARTNNTLRTSR